MFSQLFSNLALRRCDCGCGQQTDKYILGMYTLELTILGLIKNYLKKKCFSKTQLASQPAVVMVNFRYTRAIPRDLALFSQASKKYFCVFDPGEGGNLELGMQCA